MNVDPDIYRQAMGRLASGVSVLTARTGEIDHAMTADSVTSVSLDPVMLLFCVSQEARFHDAITAADSFGVSLLDHAQRPAATWFATSGRPLKGQLDRVAHHRGPGGNALLDGSMATLECAVDARHAAGDHTIVVGRVLYLELNDDPGEALVHFRGRYGSQR